MNFLDLNEFIIANDSNLTDYVHFNNNNSNNDDNDLEDDNVIKKDIVLDVSFFHSDYNINMKTSIIKTLLENAIIMHYLIK